MKMLVNLLIVLAVVSIVAGLVSRLTLQVLPLGLNASSFSQFTNTCLLFAITGILLMIRNK